MVFQHLPPSLSPHWTGHLALGRHYRLFRILLQRLNTGTQAFQSGLTLGHNLLCRSLGP